jgi:hypothetical protein
MPSYRVTWTIDVDADDEVTVAREAQRHQCKPGTEVGVFELLYHIADTLRGSPYLKALWLLDRRQELEHKLAYRCFFDRLWLGRMSLMDSERNRTHRPGCTKPQMVSI